jgi:serine O-acetyltransferase
MSLLELFTLLRADLLRLTLPANGLAPTKPRWIKILNPRFTPVLFVRFARYFYLSRWLSFFSPVFTWLNVLIFGIEFTARCDIGPGLMLPHTVGTVVGATKIGANVTIFQGATLGALTADLLYLECLRPKLGDNVIIGAGAKILGGIDIGNNVMVGANAVVLKSLSDNVVAVGIPAKVVKVVLGDSV